MRGRPQSPVRMLANERERRLAERCAEAINAYWSERGYAADAHVTMTLVHNALHDGSHAALYEIKSRLVDGRPT